MTSWIVLAVVYVCAAVLAFGFERGGRKPTPLPTAIIGSVLWLPYIAACLIVLPFWGAYELGKWLAQATEESA